MATIALKQAQAKWKKVKPVLLGKTGITQKLAPLNSYDRNNVKPTDINGWTVKFNDILKLTHQKEKEPKIKKDAKALKFLRDLGDALAEENSALRMLEGHNDEVERQQKQIDGWKKILGDALKQLNNIKQRGDKLQSEIEGTTSAVKKSNQIDGNWFQSVETLLSKKVKDLQNERQQAKPAWYNIQKEITDSKNAEVGKLLQSVIDVDGKIRENSNGVEKDMLNALNDLRSAYQQQQDSVAKEWIKLLQGVEKILQRTTTQSDKIIDGIDQVLRDGITDFNQIQKLHGKFLTEASTLQQHRRTAKNGWFPLQQPVRDSKHPQANAVLNSVVKLDAGLRLDSAGKEAAIKDLLDRLYESASSTPAASIGISKEEQQTLETHLKLQFPNVDKSTAKNAYKKWAVRNHPDKITDPQKNLEATELFKEVDGAYKALLATL